MVKIVQEAICDWKKGTLEQQTTSELYEESSCISDAMLIVYSIVSIKRQYISKKNPQWVASLQMFGLTRVMIMNGFGWLSVIKQMTPQIA